MADGYANPLLVALYERDAIYNDTLPTTDKEARRSYDVLNKLIAEYRKGGINAMVLKQWADGLKAGQSALASTQSMIAKINETAAQSDRVETKAITDLVRSTMDNTTKLATSSAQAMSMRLQPALQKFQSGTVADGIRALAPVLEGQGIKPSLENPDVGAMAQVVATTMFDKPLSELTPEEAAEKVRAAGGAPDLQEQARVIIMHGRNAYFAQGDATKSANAVAEKIYDLTATSGGVLTGKNLQDALQLLDQLGAYTQAQVGMSATEMREEMERVASLDSEYRRLEQEAEFVKSMAFQPGQEGLRTKIGRAVANDEFRAWAEDNGFRLGQARIDEDGNVIYQAGRDDERAILAYHRQLKTGKPVRLFGTSDTGKRVRITATDPEMRAQLLRDNDLGGGRYAVMDDGSDNPAVLSPIEYQSQLLKMGLADNGFEQAVVGNTVYIKKPGGEVVKYVDGKFVPLADGEPEPTGFKPAMVYSGPDDEVGRYMTADDLENPPSDPTNIGVVEPADKQKIEASSPIKIVGADDLPALGEVTFDGYLDKLNAQTISQYGAGALSINGGQHVFTKGVTVEVLETRGRGEPLVNARERRAKRRGEQADIQTLTAGQVRRAKPPAAEPPPPAPPVPVSEMTARAAADTEFAAPRLEMQVAGGVTAPREAAAAREAAGAAAPAAGAAAAAAPLDHFKDAAGYTYKVEGQTIKVVGWPEGKEPPKKEFQPGDREYDAVATNLNADMEGGRLEAVPAPTPAAEAAAAEAAPAAREPKARYFKTPRGTYKADESGYTMVEPPPGEVMPEKPPTIPYGTADAEAITEAMEAPLSEAEAAKIETRLAGMDKTPKPREVEAKVTERRGSTVIDYGKRRTLGGDIRDMLERMRKGREAKNGEAAAEKPEAAPKPPKGKAPLERREEMKRQEALTASLATATDAVPERAPARPLPAQNLGAEPMYTEVTVPGRRAEDVSMSREEVLAAGRQQAAQARKETPPTMSEVEAKLTPEQREAYRVRTEMASRYAPRPVAKGEEPKGTGEPTPMQLSPAGKLALFRRMQQAGAKPLTAEPAK